MTNILSLYKEILFIHIPKTAGKSISSFLQSKELDNWKREKILNHHDPVFLLEQKNNISNAFKFSVVRNPYTRAFSHYNHVVKVRKMPMTFNDFLTYVRLNGNLRLFNSKFASFFIERLPLISYTQSFYLHDSSGLFSIDKIYRFENLVEFENDFDCKLPFENVSGYKQIEYLQNYTQQNINLVKYIYKSDFELFNYSEYFDDSIKL